MRLHAPPTHIPAGGRPRPSQLAHCPALGTQPHSAPLGEPLALPALSFQNAAGVSMEAGSLEGHARGRVSPLGWRALFLGGGADSSSPPGAQTADPSLNFETCRWRAEPRTIPQGAARPGPEPKRGSNARVPPLWAPNTWELGGPGGRRRCQRFKASQALKANTCGHEALGAPASGSLGETLRAGPATGRRVTAHTVTRTLRRLPSALPPEKGPGVEGSPHLSASKTELRPGEGH